MWLLLSKKFGALQWVAVCLLVVSATVSQGPQIVGEETAGLSWRLVMGLGVMVVLATSAGFASVRNELIFKREREDRMPFMLQNAVMYVWGIGLNLSSWAVWGKHGFLEGFTPTVWVSVVCASAMGLMVAMMLKYLDNVVKCFSGVGQVLFTVLASRLLPDHLHKGSFDIFYLASLVTLAVSLVLYQGHASKRLPLLMFTALVSSLVIGLACMREQPSSGCEFSQGSSGDWWKDAGSVLQNECAAVLQKCAQAYILPDCLLFAFADIESDSCEQSFCTVQVLPIARDICVIYEGITGYNWRGYIWATCIEVPPLGLIHVLNDSNKMITESRISSTRVII
eukprot:522873-Amphidinium_carterae.1